MLVELHSHTHYSRGTKIFYESLHRPREMLAQAKKLGAGAIAITDHDEIKGALEAKKLSKKMGIEVIVSEEVTSASGHVLALGINEWIQPMLSVAETVERIHEQGGVAIAPHPFDFKRNGIRMECLLCDGIEVFNAMSIDRITNKKALKIAKARNLPMTAGSDAHSVDMLGYGMTRVDAHDAESILKEVRKGSTSLVTTYMPVRVIRDHAVAKLKLSYDYTMQYIEKNYSNPKKYMAKKMLGLVNKSPGRIDEFFKLLSYVTYGGVLFYSRFDAMVGFNPFREKMRRS